VTTLDSPSNALGYKCSQCKELYTVDLFVPVDVWERIRPERSIDGGGLLCGSCIMKRMEAVHGFETWKIARV
jgi:hypothetical protein